MQTKGTSVPRIAWKEFLPALIVVFNSLVWYALTYDRWSKAIIGMEAPAGETFIIFGFYYTAIACSGIVGAVFLEKKRRLVFVLWMLIGAVVTATLTTVPNNSVAVNVLISIFLGIASGIGLPSCFACFGDATVVENRGIHGGIAWATIGLGILALGLVVQEAVLFLAFGVLALWRMLGLIAFVLSSRNLREIPRTQRSSSFLSILHRREVVLYLVPWIMFSLINFTEAPILERVFGNLYTLVGFVEFAITGLFALVGGLLADRVGRKRIVITGFIFLGIEYALLSLFSDVPITWYMYTVFDGVAWGMFASVFFMTLWGDLAGDRSKEKYYVLGGLPYFLGGFLPILVRPYANMIQTGTAFSLASFFLFLAVLPLMYAPETLPEKAMRQRELEKYVGEAKKIKEKSKSKN